jgi:hypothetical protein
MRTLLLLKKGERERRRGRGKGGREGPIKNKKGNPR